MPWDRTEPHPVLADWLGDSDGEGRRAVVVGCGLGADAEHLAAPRLDDNGLRHLPLPSLRRASGIRTPRSTTASANLLDPSPDLVGAFDLVVEIYTLQALHPSVRPAAADGLRRLLAPGGTAFVVQAIRARRRAVDRRAALDADRRRWRPSPATASSSSRSTRRSAADRDSGLWRMALQRR